MCFTTVQPMCLPSLKHPKKSKTHIHKKITAQDTGAPTNSAAVYLKLNISKCLFSIQRAKQHHFFSDCLKQDTKKASKHKKAKEASRDDEKIELCLVRDKEIFLFHVLVPIMC